MSCRRSSPILNIIALVAIGVEPFNEDDIEEPVFVESTQFFEEEEESVELATRAESLDEVIVLVENL